jgi:hypothetical protein
MRRRPAVRRRVSRHRPGRSNAVGTARELPCRARLSAPRHAAPEAYPCRSSSNLPHGSHSTIYVNEMGRGARAGSSRPDAAVDIPPSDHRRPHQTHPSFPAMPCTVETTSIASLRFGAAALIIATVMSSTLAADRAASSEPTPPMMYREGSSAAYPFAEFVAEASQRFGVATS